MHTRGFTLMEVLIYIALFGIIMSGAMVATFQLVDGGTRNEQSIAIQEEGTFISRKINWALAGASSASAAGNTLTIVRPDLGSGSPIVIAAGTSTITLTRGSGSPVTLSGDVFPITGVLFSVDGASGSTAVTASFTIRTTPFIFRTYLQ